MVVLRAVLGKDLRVLWASALPWAVGALLQAVLGLLFVNELTARGQAVTQPMVPLAGFLLLALSPALTMRAIAEERRHGTLDLLLAVPVPPGSLVVGKWLASWSTALVTLAPAAAVVAVLFRIGDPDAGPVVAGFLGLALFAAGVTAIGVMTSSLTSSQPVAALVSLFGTLLLWFAHVGSETLRPGAVLARLSMSERLRSFAGGAVDSGDVAFFVALTVGALLVSTSVVARGRPVVAVGGLLVVLVLSGVADEHRRQFDLTADRELTLSDETLAVLGRIERPVRITAFLSRPDPGRVAAPTLLSRYRRANPRISFRLLDPSSSRAEASRLGIDPALGGLALSSGDRVELAPAAIEQDITSALARLLRSGPSTLCVASGHGEADVLARSEQGLSTAAATLRENGYRLEPVDLLVTPEVPASCDALLIANPVSPLGPAELGISTYLAAGGRAVVLLDPSSTVELADVLGPFGLGVRRGLVLEGDAGGRLSDDPFRPVVRDYRGGTSIVRRLAPTFFPAVQATTVDDEAVDATEGLAASGAAFTSRLSFLETEPATVGFDPASDLPGPVAVVATADRSSVDAQGVVRSRIVLVGDVDFATNASIGEASNGELLIRSVDWVTMEESLVTVSANVARLRPLQLTEGRLRYLRLLAVGIIPSLFLVLGALSWALRRGR